MNPFTAPQKRRLTSLFGLLALVAITGSLALDRSANADTNLLLQQPNLSTVNPAASPFGDHKTYTEISTSPDEKGVYGFLNDFNSLLFVFAGAFAILAFFAGAYSYFLSGGNEENMKKGRTQMLGSVIAFIIIAGAAGVVSIAEKLFKSGKPF